MGNKILIVILVVLFAAVGGFAWHNWQQARDIEPAVLTVRLEGQEVGTISLTEIKQLGGQEFSVILRSSGQAPREQNYTGVPLKLVLEAVQPGMLDGKISVTVTAIDGYAVTFSANELFQEEHIYLVWAQDGQPLGDKASGGSGPLLVIPRQDEFGQRWCKFAVRVDVQ